MNHWRTRHRLLFFWKERTNSESEREDER